MRTTTFNAMGSRILIAQDTTDDLIQLQAQKASVWFEEWEQCLTRFRISSELSEINRHPGVTHKVSAIFSEVLEAATQAESLSDGLVTPKILNALISAGYDQDFEDLLARSDTDFARYILSPVSPGRVVFHSKSRTVTLPFGTQLDFGGIAKGWAAHQAMTRLSEFSPVLVDAGGDIAISGNRSDGTPWPVGVANPFDADRNLALLMLERGGIATSGRDYHRWVVNGNPRHHIIDPRNSLPADSDIFTVTILANDVLEAETYAKTALILGSEEARAKLESLPGISYLLVLENGTVVKNVLFSEKEWKPECQIN
jgi:thiamine biosynthesis lipoprotein